MSWIMRKTISAIIGGVTGAAVLNTIHQSVAQFDHDAPRVDLVGEESLSKGFEKVGLKPPTGNALFTATLAADLLSNATYYSLIGLARKKHLLAVGAVTGLAAGVGALALTKPMGLSDAPVTRTEKTKLLTVAWYTIGGLVAGAVILSLRNKK